MRVQDTNKIEHNQYTYTEFIDYAENRKVQSQFAGNESSKKKNRDGWSGTDTFEEALELARNGWDAGIKQMELEGGILSDVGTVFEPNVYGSVVNMNSYLQGLPDNMYNMREEREYNMPLLTIYVSLSYHAGNSNKKAMRFAHQITKVVNKYQATHNVRLDGLYATSQDGKGFVGEVLVKDYDERFVLNNVAFMFHTSCFRRIFFAHIEGCKFGDRFGYGRTLDHSEIEKMVRGFKITDHTILLPSLNELSNGSFGDDKIITIKK